MKTLLRVFCFVPLVLVVVVALLGPHTFERCFGTADGKLRLHNIYKYEWLNQIWAGMSNTFRVVNWENEWPPRQYNFIDKTSREYGFGILLGRTAAVMAFGFAILGIVLLLQPSPLQKGYAALSAGRWAIARRTFKAILDRDPNNEEAIEGLRLAEERQRP